MDELFRQAAAGYPLKTDNSDWDGLASRLLITPGTPVPGQKKNKFNNYGLPLLLILLMLVVGESPIKQTRIHLTADAPSDANREANNGKETALSNFKNTTAQHQNHSKSQLNREAPITDHIPANNRPTNNPIPEKSAHKNVSIVIDAPDLTYNTDELAMAHKINSAGTNLPFHTTIDKAPGITEKKIDTNQRSPKMYWGIVFGPGINRVKNQKLLKPGFDIGIMAGISMLKEKVFVEAGLLYTEKYYFSDGKYFNMEKAGGSMPQGMEIMSVEGSSRLFELPVKFKYSVLQKNRSGIFLSTGISSYLMTREENDYQAMMNGSEQNMVGSYKNNKRYIAVMANIGAEYNYKIGKHTRLRIEPYFQIPLKGIGIGAMPVMTTGIHFGFMRFTP